MDAYILDISTGVTYARGPKLSAVEDNGDSSSSVKHSPPGKGGEAPVSIGLVNNNGNPSSSVQHSPPGEGGGLPVSIGLVNNNGDPSSSDATGSMNAPLREGDVERGRVNNNGDPREDVASSGWGLKVAMIGFSAAASRPPTTSKFAIFPAVIGVFCNVLAILLTGTNNKAATANLAKVGIVAVAVVVLFDMGKDVPPPLFVVAMIAAIGIIIATMVFAKRLN